LTSQIKDTCILNGRLWDIIDKIGNIDIIPTNQILGIYTITESTANWSGRIDHYIIIHNYLYLFKISVTMINELSHLIPKGTRREIITRTERIMRTDRKGTRVVFQDDMITNLIFDDIFVHFTGKLVLKYPHYDPWEYPREAFQEEDLEYSEEAIVTLQSGSVVDAKIEEI